MPRKRKYFFSALIILLFGVIAANTWLSRTALADSDHVECQTKPLPDEGHDENAEPGGKIEAIIGIQLFNIYHYLPTTQYISYPIIHSYIRPQYLDVLTPPPWFKS